MRLLRQLLRFLLRELAVLRLARERPVIVGITGSVGKTTTKEAVFAVLSHRWPDRVRRSAGNLNTEEGVPLSILGFQRVPSRWEYPLVLLGALGQALWVPPARGGRPILVLELAAERPGDIEYLVSFLKPYLAVGVVTTVGPIHLDPGQFPSVEAIAQEKGKLVESLDHTGWAILNRDNPHTKAMAARTRATVVWFADRGVESAKAVARAVGKIFGVPASEAQEVLKRFRPPYGRLNELPGIKGSTVIDDSYNANPLSMEQALAILAKRSGRRIAVLGDMLELGQQEELYHRQVGKLARAAADVVVGVGRRARWYQPTYHFAQPAEAAHFLKKFVRAGDVVLVKGSQSMRMEKVSEALLIRPDDQARLPRQTAAWKARPFVQP